MEVAEKENIEHIWKKLLSKKRVLIIEDEPGLGKALQKVMEKYLDKVEISKTSRSALNRLSRRSFDIILTDIINPKIEGIELLRKIKGRADGTPIILMIHHQSVRYTFDVLDYHVDEYLIKPFNENELTQMIIKTLIDS